jgi:hypothetical protein
MSYPSERKSFRPEGESAAAKSFRLSLRQLFVAQADTLITLRDYNPLNWDKVTEKFLGGTAPLHHPNYYGKIAIRSWSKGEGNENVSISVESDQFLITGAAMVSADTPNQPLSDTTIMVLQGWLGPERAIWTKAESRQLANQQLALYTNLDRSGQRDIRLT